MDYSVSKNRFWMMALVFSVVFGLGIETTYASSSHAHTSEKTDVSMMAKASSLEINKINQLNQLILAEKSSQNSGTAKLQSIINIRKQSVLKLMRTNPLGIFSVSIPADIRATLSKEVQSGIEKAVTLDGTIDVLAIDDFVNKKTLHLYYLNIGKERMEFFPAGDSMMHVRSGTRVKISGLQLDNIVVALNDGVNIQITAPIPPPESVGDQKTLVILMDFLDSGPQPFTSAQARNLVFNGQFQNFFKEQSYNKVSFSGDVLGWYTVPRNLDNQNCYVNGLPLEASVHNSDLFQYISQNNLNLHNYKRVVYLINHQDFGGGCSGVGAIDHTIGSEMYRLSESWVGNIRSYNQHWSTHPFTWTLLDYIMSHEVGHALGVLHANGWDCGDQSINGNCEHIEYGNPFDVMGDGESTLHFNALYKELLGWISPSEVNLITTTGDYSIGTLESASSTKKVAKIQMQGTSKKPFYLEYRRAVGFDSNLNNSNLVSNQDGLFINKIMGASEGWMPYPRLIDASPTLMEWDADIEKVTLNGSNILNDQVRGITVGPIINNDSNTINFRVRVDPPTCERRNPLITSVYFDDQAQAGGILSGFLTFRNEDFEGCPASTFTLTTSMPAGWSIHGLGHTANRHPIYPEGSGWGSIWFNVSDTTHPGVYPVSVTIRNNDSGRQTTENLLVTVVSTPMISSITPSYGLPNTSVTLRGSGFSALNQGQISISGADQFFGITLRYNPSHLVPADSLNFDFPTHMYASNCPTPDGCLQPTLPGIYTIYLRHNNLYTNWVSFEVTSPAPHISSLTSYYGSIGSQITVRGSGFNPTNYVRFRGGGSNDVVLNTSSSNGNSISFTIPTSSSLPPGPIEISVSNDNITFSNPMSFILTSNNTTNSPIISSLVPTSGSAGSVVTIHGSGEMSNGIFSPVLTVDGCSPAQFMVGYSASTGNRVFTVPNALPCGSIPNSIAPGTYIVQVFSPTWQVSNSTYFMVTTSPRPSPAESKDQNTSVKPTTSSSTVPTLNTSSKMQSANVIDSLKGLLGQMNGANQTAEVNSAINQLLKNLKAILGK